MILMLHLPVNILCDKMLKSPMYHKGRVRKIEIVNQHLHLPKRHVFHKLFRCVYIVTKNQGKKKTKECRLVHLLELTNALGSPL